MITKFLYQLDNSQRKVIVGIVEDDEIETIDSLTTFKLVQDTKAILRPNDKVLYNVGKQGYIVFHSEDGDRYLDINIFGDEVKINVTKNISFASSYSEDFFGVILDYASYFGFEDVEFIFNGMKKSKNGSIDDEYDHYFKRVTDASYCKINKDDKAYFLSRNEDMSYFLTPDFSQASKVKKNEIRKVLIINKFINSKTERKDLSFSPYKALVSDNVYYYAGLNPFKATYTDDVLTLELEPVIDVSARLIKSEEIFLGLKDVSYLISKEKTNKRYYLEVDGKYVKETSPFMYEFVSNPFDASPLLDYDIEIVKSLLKVFDPSKKVLRKNKNNFMYYEKNIYTLTDNAISGYDNGKMIDKDIYDEFISTFNTDFNNKKRDSGLILIRDGKYLSMEIISSTRFSVYLSDSSYNASLFTDKEAKVLEKLFNWNFKYREIKNLLVKDLSLYKINIDNKKSILDEYKNIMKDITSKKTPVVAYDKPSEIKCETEKGALEYLRRFYMKDVFDFKKLFELVLNDEIKNVLIVSTKFNLELQGLALAANSKLNVTILNENKFGYLPNIYLNNNIKIDGMYRLKLQNLPKTFLKSYDLIVFGLGFDEDEILFKDTLDELCKDDRDVVFVNTKHAQFEPEVDKFYEYFLSKISLKRKYFNYDMPYTDDILALDEEFTNYLYRIQSINQYPSVKLDKKYSYHSIVIKHNNELKDFYKKED